MAPYILSGFFAVSHVAYTYYHEEGVENDKKKGEMKRHENSVKLSKKIKN